MIGPLLGLQTKTLDSFFASLNPRFIALEIFFESCFLSVNAITDGPAPLIVTPYAPAANAFFFTLSNPGIICFLAGSTITSSTDHPISSEFLFEKPATIPDAFEIFFTTSNNETFFGITPLETLVFFAGTFNSGTATHKTKSFGG